MMLQFMRYGSNLALAIEFLMVVREALDWAIAFFAYQLQQYILFLKCC